MLYIEFGARDLPEVLDVALVVGDLLDRQRVDLEPEHRHVLGRRLTDAVHQRLAGLLKFLALRRDVFDADAVRPRVIRADIDVASGRAAGRNRERSIEDVELPLDGCIGPPFPWVGAVVEVVPGEGFEAA